MFNSQNIQKSLMTKTILILSIAAAFVAGMIVSGSSVFAQGIGTSPGIAGQILRALESLQDTADNTNTKVGDIDEKIDTIIATPPPACYSCGDGIVTPELGESCDPPDATCTTEGCCTAECKILVL